MAEQTNGSKSGRTGQTRKIDKPGSKTRTGIVAKKPAHDPGRFLDLPAAASNYQSARAVILSMPLEASVSYGGGTAKGPEAIIEASRQVEPYDPNLDREPAMAYGIHTLAELPVFAGPQQPEPRAALDAIAAEAALHLAAGKFVVGLGGEHTVSLGMAEAVGASGDFTVVHIDAHADLRDSYEGDPLSHACVIRRIAELPQCEQVLQLGIRSTSKDQVEFATSWVSQSGRYPAIRTWYAEAMHSSKRWRKELKQAVRGRRVFVTFDVDGLDPAIVPATGTPEPNGLSWKQLMRIARIVADNSGEVAAMDCVELAPVAGLHHAEFTVARAVYAMMNMFITL